MYVYEHIIIDNIQNVDFHNRNNIKQSKWLNWYQSLDLETAISF